MKYSQGRTGRIFVLRLEQGDTIPGCIENFAKDKNIKAGYVIVVGGTDKGDIVVGPRVSDAPKPQKMMLPINGAHEILASGVIAPDDSGQPLLHIHGALGRSGQTMTGCLREGIGVWLVCEVIIHEILDADILRAYDHKTGFNLLKIT
jgi:uncharacterized protein